MNNATASASTPANTARAEVRQRLAQLESYLQSDPNNNALLVDAFETALACGEWLHAQNHLQQGKTMGSEAIGWQLREGDLWLAQKKYERAREVLQALVPAAQGNAELMDVLIHNTAYIDFQEGAYPRCVDTLRPHMVNMLSHAAPSAGEGSLSMGALQCLWLRALHQTAEVNAACEWTLQAEQAGILKASAAGIAALIAVDAEQMPAAQRWCNQAMTQGKEAVQLEALVAQGTLALGRQDAQLALQSADAALQRSPQDGRSWSLKAFAHMLAQDMPAAIQSFDRAVQTVPQHIGTWIGRGWALALHGALAPAQQSFETAVELDRNFAESHGGLAVVLAMQDSREAAAEHVELAMRLDRDNLSGQFAQAILRGEVRDPASLQRLTQRILGGLGVLNGNGTGPVLSSAGRNH